MSPNIFHRHNSNSRNTTQSTITDSHNDSSVYEHYQLNFTNCTLYIHPAAIQEIPFVSPGDSAQYQNFQTHTDSVHENTNIGGGAQDQYRQHSELTAERPRVRRAHNPFSASPEPSFQPASQERTSPFPSPPIPSSTRFQSNNPYRFSVQECVERDYDSDERLYSLPCPMCGSFRAHTRGQDDAKDP